MILSEEQKTKFQLLQDAAVTALEELVKSFGGWAINYARIRVSEVYLTIDRDGDETWQVVVSGGQDAKLEQELYEKLVEDWSPLEVRVEW